MEHLGADRNFSAHKHDSGDWRTTLVGSVSAPVNLLVRYMSFKHQELYRFAHRCFSWYTVVDFGCGTGAYSAYFLDHAPSTVIATDWSFAALRALPHTDGRCLAVCADLHALPFKQGAIDALFSIDTIGHLRNQAIALDEIVRVCRNGAPVFLHSECSDYRNRWPDRTLIRRIGRDALAEIDGHFNIQPSERMRMLFAERFTITDFFSPAGTLGWILGYPEKYVRLFRMAERPLYARITAIFSFAKSVTPLKYAMRSVNIFSNRLELALGLTGGGSCFVRGKVGSGTTTCTERPDPAVDVIVPTWGRPYRIERLVGELLGQCAMGDRIIIVWQGNQKPSVPVDRRVVLLHLEIVNLPAARNAGLIAGENPVLLFVDDDCMAYPGLLDAHRHCYVDRSVGAVAGYIDDPLFCGDFPKPSCFNKENGEIRQNFNIGYSGAAISLMGANMSFRRSVLEKIGGFDTQYIHNALWEDVDASFRVQNAGYVLWYCSEARVRHLRSETGGCRSDSSIKYLYYYFRNTAYFACTYVPRDKVTGWLRFWMYRLEYFSRKDYVPRWWCPFKHDPRRVMAGISGALAGCTAWTIRGTRSRLPVTIGNDENTAVMESV